MQILGPCHCRHMVEAGTACRMSVQGVVKVPQSQDRDLRQQGDSNNHLYGRGAVPPVPTRGA